MYIYICIHTSILLSSRRTHPAGIPWDLHRTPWWSMLAASPLEAYEIEIPVSH